MATALPGTAVQPADDEPVRSGDASLSERLPRAWLFPFAVFAAVWVLILTTWRASDAIYHVHRPWTFHFDFKDSDFYLAIAQHGYPATLPHPWNTADGRVAFFPLLPMLIRAASYLVGGSYATAALVVEVLAGAASSLGVWALAARLRGHRVADRAVLLYCFFPGAMTFGMVYEEPLAVALASATLLALVNRRWLIAGALAGIGTAERETLIVLTPIIAVAAIWHLVRPGDVRRRWHAPLAVLLAPLGMLGFFAYLGRRYHDYGFWFYAERAGWGTRPGVGTHAVSVGLWLDPVVRHMGLIETILSAMFVAATAGVVLTLAARLPLPVTLYQLGVVALTVLPPTAVTKPRFVWLAFPAFIAAAVKLPRWLYVPLLLLSAAGLAFVIGWWPNHLNGAAP